MATLDTDAAIDWTACELIWPCPRQSLRQACRGGTLVFVLNAIVGSFDLGETIEELHEGFPMLTISQNQTVD